MTAPIVSAPPDSLAQRPVTVSVVSHGHRELVARLLGQLCVSHGGQIDRVVVTHNLPAEPVAPPPGGWPFALTQLHNPAPAGFGANHNRAFGHCATPLFAVLNPDIELPHAGIWPPLVEAAQQPGVGCAYPQLVDPDGSRQDSERELVSPLALARRHVLKRRQARVDWVSAAFWLVPAPVWRRLGGFDERYFMYCEDVDFCLRLQLEGFSLQRAPVSAVHLASRASRRLGRHLAWHLASLLRLWLSRPFRRFARRPAPGPKSRQ